MADKRPSTDGPSPFDAESYDFTKLPDNNNDFVDEEDLAAFARALSAPDTPSTDDFTQAPHSTKFITALNDWRPVRQRVRRDDVRKKRRRKLVRRGKDETREGYVYTLLKWPMLFVVLGWIVFLGAAYLCTRLYVYSYEHFVAMRGKREALRKKLQSARTYHEWVGAARDIDGYLGNEKWKEYDDYAYYNSSTIRRVRDELRNLRLQLQEGKLGENNGSESNKIADDLRTLIEAAVKDNFVGIENPRLYSETYYGTKNLLQSFIDELELSLKTLSNTSALGAEQKASMFTHLYTNYGKTAFCLSGGATFAYYHFGVAKALLDADVMPKVITGTSGGAIVASLICTRTDAELKRLLVPALAKRITACKDSFGTWSRRLYRTGARFDSLEWARNACFFTRGNLTFREAYQRTGRVLNVTCIPSDPHSPTVLANYLTAPDCVIWSAVLASAAVPGILNPVVLMKKNRSGKLAPYSFGHKWKDGSLRTDIPLRALNTHFNVNFSIVSQVNPHINLFFFSSRGTVGRPVTHRRGRGWRGGFLGSATEQYLKLDLHKWLKVLRHLELLPRPLGQDWSEVWLQRFSGTVTIWPKSIPSDFAHILSDPSAERLARMIHVGQLSTFPKLKFIANRFKIERLIEAGLKAGTSSGAVNGEDAVTVPHVLSEEDLEGLLHQARKQHGTLSMKPARINTASSPAKSPSKSPSSAPGTRAGSPSLTRKLSGWWSSPRHSVDADAGYAEPEERRSSVISELGRQTRVFFDDADADEQEHDSELDTGSAGGSLVGTDDEMDGADGSDEMNGDVHY